MDCREVVQRVLDTIRRADADAYASLFAENAVMHHPLAATPLEGRAAIRESERALFEAFSDIQIEIVTLLGSDTSAAVEVVLRAKHTGTIDLGDGQVLQATQRQIEVPAAWFFEVSPEGLIRAERDYFDAAAFMAQFGPAV